MQYLRAQQLMDTARNGYSKPLQNNTRLERHAEGFAVILHGTAVVVIREDGTYRLNTGGWATMTTKDRINGYSPAQVYSDRGTWYVAAERSDDDPEPSWSWDDKPTLKAHRAWERRNRVAFTDGMIVNAVGRAGARDPDAQLKAAKAWCRSHGLRPRNGHVTLWKAVDADYTSGWGAKYTPRTKVVAKDYLPTEACGAGLHFGPDANTARRYAGHDSIVLKCRVPLDTLIALDDKCKAKSCYVIGRFDA